MPGIVVKLRYPPHDPAGGPSVQKEDLDRIARQTGADISLTIIDPGNGAGAGETAIATSEDSTIEGMAQRVITVASDDEIELRTAVLLLIDLYRAPRTVYGTWGSSEEGAKIISELLDEEDGWY